VLSAVAEYYRLLDERGYASSPTLEEMAFCLGAHHRHLGSHQESDRDGADRCRFRPVCERVSAGAPAEAGCNASGRGPARRTRFHHATHRIAPGIGVSIWLTVKAKALADLKIEKAAVEGERRTVEADLPRQKRTT
jgi:hypothetical protein